ncbi:MAG: PGN_0703 family putative restriction endonuclease [Anaerolineae bacterium]
MDEELRSHYCLESVDRVPGDPETTAFKRWARLHQALWRESRGLEIGTQPMRPKPDGPSRPLGSRIELGVAMRTGANFLSDAVRQSVARRLGKPQPYQTLNGDRLYCDLLSSMPMCFNLFAELQADLSLANRAVHTWWPDTPGTVTHVCFEWSPGRRLEGQYLENSSAFDVAFVLALCDGKEGVLGVETKYHEDCRKEKCPTSERLERYKCVTAASGIMAPECVDQILGTDLQQVWLDHLLAASMPLHESRNWGWAGFALVHPAGNPSYARATERYRTLLSAPSSLRVNTIESLIEADVLPDAAATAFVERYL